jgi:anti-anti-sigma factor
MADERGLEWVSVRGRIDGMTSNRIQEEITELVRKGNRSIGADLTDVDYISSAGLRVFLQVQKQLRKAGGEIILCGLSPALTHIFEVAGLLPLFRLVSSREEIPAGGNPEEGPEAAIPTQIDGISFQCSYRGGAPGRLGAIGSSGKLPHAAYTEEDVAAVAPEAFRFGAGLASLGDRYEEYGKLFGESVIIEQSLFFLPSAKRPVVDFMLFPEGRAGVEYRFLHGFGFGGAFSRVAFFESAEGGFVTLERLVPALFELSRAELLGLVILAESKGVWGMHLKKAPIAQNRPANGKEIFDPANFPEWMHFPMEPSDINNVVLGVGIAARDREAAGPEIRAFLPGGGAYHIHAGIFSKEPLSRNVHTFESELKRTATELEVFRVEHLLGKSSFASGTVGLIELEG